MNRLLILIPFFLASSLIGQITFEEISVPDEFAVGNLLKTKSGEYLLQHAKFRGTVYSTFDKENWTTKERPVWAANDLFHLQYFTDGDFVLTSYDTFQPDMVFNKGNGNWHILKIGSDELNGTYIEGDTLFVFNDNEVHYSLNNGASFSSLFETQNVSPWNEPLWKVNGLFLVKDLDDLYVFDNNGVLIYQHVLEGMAFTDKIYETDCGDLLFVDGSKYCYISESGSVIECGLLNQISPGAVTFGQIGSQDSSFYFKTGQTIYKSDPCTFNWSEIATAPIDGSMRIGDSGELLIFNQNRDTIREFKAGSSNWETWDVNITHPVINYVDECFGELQYCRNSGNFYFKHKSDDVWSLIPETASAFISPNGSLYKFDNSLLYFSSDNGLSFESIELPESAFLDATIELFNIVADNLLFLVYAEPGYAGSFETFYSLDNGETWIETDFDYSITLMGSLKLVGDELFVVQRPTGITSLYRLNLQNNNWNVDSIATIPNDFGSGPIIQSDGTVIVSTDLTGGWGIGPYTYYRYPPGGPTELLGVYDGSPLVNSLSDELYILNNDNYQIYNGQEFELAEYHGLPEGYSLVFLSKNDYVYFIKTSTRIFRSTEPLSGLPLLSGNVYFDQNENCTDDGEQNLSGWKINARNANYSRTRFTNTAGDYQFHLPYGDYEVSAQLYAADWESCQSSYSVSMTIDNPAVVQDMPIKALSDCAHLSLDFSTPFLRRCFDNTYYITVKNTGPSLAENVSLTLTLDTFFDFVSTSELATQLSDSIWQFDIGNLNLGESRLIQLVVNVSCSSDIGQTHCLSGILALDGACETAQLTFQECQENIGSWDPNDKRAFSEQGLETDRVDKGEYIYYHIRFQNTGSDTAFNVKIVDAISPLLDLSTLQLLSASHPYTFSIDDEPQLEVLFENIMLPDSMINEAASHGYFKFKIKPITDLEYGTVIPNQASILFDFNAAVITDIVEVELAMPNTVHTLFDLMDFEIFPNPANTNITIRLNEKAIAHNQKVLLYDKMGRLLATRPSKAKIQMDIEELPAGLYFVVLQNESGLQGHKRFLKM